MIDENHDVKGGLTRAASRDIDGGSEGREAGYLKISVGATIIDNEATNLETVTAEGSVESGYDGGVERDEQRATICGATGGNGPNLRGSRDRCQRRVHWRHGGTRGVDA